MEESVFVDQGSFKQRFWQFLVKTSHPGRAPGHDEQSVKIADAG